MKGKYRYEFEEYGSEKKYRMGYPFRPLPRIKFPKHPNNQPLLPQRLTHSLWFPSVYLPLYSLYASINDSSSFLAIKKIARDKTEKIANKRTGRIDIPYTYNKRTNTDTKYSEITNNIMNIARERFYDHTVASS